MPFKKALEHAGDLGSSALSRSKEALTSGLELTRSTIQRSSLLARLTSSSSYGSELTDERHYFLVPDRTTESGYTVCVLRCLPPGVPPINDLAKRRILHLPSAHAEGALRDILTRQARRDVEADGPQTPLEIGRRLGDLANEIDQLEGKLFGGAIMIGGLVALANPIAGAALAVKALAPSVALVLSKHGLRLASDGADDLDVARRVKRAENEIKREFRSSTTRGLLNPVLAQIDEAIGTSEREYDPLLDFDPEEIDATFDETSAKPMAAAGDASSGRLLELTCRAVTDVYAPILASRRRRKQAGLGPEDVRFLELVAHRATLAEQEAPIEDVSE